MKKAGGLLIIVAYTLLSVYCNLEGPTYEPVETVLDTEIIIEEQRIMNDFIVKPIVEYPAYFAQGHNVSGIPADAKGPADLLRFLPEIVINDNEAVAIFDQFFAISGKVYFTITINFANTEDSEESETITKYCMQSKGVLTYLTEAKFPAIPESVRVEGTTGKYNIDIGEYQGDPINIVSRDYSETLIFVDGFLAIEGGLLIHALVGRGSSRPDGLLFWPDNARTMNLWKEPGRFWK